MQNKIQDGGDNVDGLKIYFSDFFNVDEDIIESYGAVNISLINDMPLFVDPFLWRLCTSYPT